MRGLLGILVATLCACASGPPGVDLEALLEREAGPLAESDLASSDGYFSARVAAVIEEPVTFEAGEYSATLSIGAEYPLNCWIYVEPFDSASALANLSDLTRDSIEKQLGPVELRRLHWTDAGSIAGAPFLAAEWLYRANHDGQQVVTQAKIRLAAKAQRTIACMHIETGYHESFERFFEGLVASIEFANSPKRPYYAEIFTVSVGGRRVGYQYGTMLRDEEGDTRATNVSALFMPVGPEEVMTTDSYQVEYSRPDGSLINQISIESENGELTTNLKFDPQPDEVWQVGGIFQGKELTATIEAPSPLTSSLGDLIRVRDALSNDGVDARVVLPKWIPEADPTRLLETKIAVQEALSDGRYRADAELGPLEFEVVLGSQGSWLRAKVEMGAAEMIIERVWHDGAY
jgi:hypothetical protein